MANVIGEVSNSMTSTNQKNGQPSDANSMPLQLPRTKPLETPTKLSLHFWGTRGSIPVSGPDYLHYGGNTSCVSLTSNTGHLFIFDVGSGARLLGNYLMSPEWQRIANPHGETDAINAYIMLSHTHWDHIQGFPFFVPAFKPGNHFHIIGCSNCSQPLDDILGGQMQQCYFPVSLDSLPAEIGFYSVQPHETAEIDGAFLYNQLLKHPIPTTAYRLELGGKVLTYATDHEPHALPHLQPHQMLGYDVIDENLVALAKDADVLIHDAQYSTAELAQKVGWGHNSAEVAVDTAIQAGVKKLVMYHHDPAHDDVFINKLLAEARLRVSSLGNYNLEVIAACDGMELEL